MLKIDKDYLIVWGYLIKKKRNIDLNCADIQTCFYFNYNKLNRITNILKFLIILDQIRRRRRKKISILI